MFERSIDVLRRCDLISFKLRLQEFEVTDYILRQRTDTKLKQPLVTIVRFILHHLNYPLEAGKMCYSNIGSTLNPPLNLDMIRGGIYRDELCLFHCLSVQTGRLTDSLQNSTLSLYTKWVGFAIV